MRLTCKTFEEKIGAIGGLEKFGIFSLTYVADKTKDLAKEYKGNTLTKIVKMVVSLTERSYEDFILKNERKSMGTYCVPITHNKLLWKHKTKDEFYLRFYRIGNSDHKPIVLRYYINGKKVTKEEWEKAYDEWVIPSAKNKQPSEVYNIKLNNIIKIKQGKTVITFK